MLFHLLGKTVWFVGKMTVKHVLVPIAITAGTALVLGKLVERLDASAERRGAEPNGSRTDGAASSTLRSRAPKPAMDA